MLIITRRDGQGLILETSDGLIEITIDTVLWGEVKLEIDAPRGVGIVREELRKRLHVVLH